MAINSSFQKNILHSEHVPALTYPETREEAIEIAERNLQCCTVLREIPLTVWNRVFEYTGWEGLDAMERSTSVFVRSKLANSLKSSDYSFEHPVLKEVPPNLWSRVFGYSGWQGLDAMERSTLVFVRSKLSKRLNCSDYYFKNRVAVFPGIEIEQPVRAVGVLGESGQAQDLAGLTQQIAEISQDLVRLQQECAALQTGLSTSDLLQLDDLPAFFTHIFSDQQASDPLFQERGRRLFKFFDCLMTHGNALSLGDWQVLYTCATRVCALALRMALCYPDVKIFSSRLEEFNGLVTSCMGAQFEYYMKIVSYDVLKESEFNHQFSIAQLISSIPGIVKFMYALRASSAPERYVMIHNCVASLPALEQRGHLKLFPRWDLWLARFPEVISHSGLRDLLITDPASPPIPIRAQVASLAQKMFDNMVRDRRPCSKTEKCCEGRGLVLRNLGRLSLLDGLGNRMQVLCQLLKEGVDPDLLEMIGYQHKNQPFNRSEIEQLLRVAFKHLGWKEAHQIAQIVDFHRAQFIKTWAMQMRVVQLVAVSILGFMSLPLQMRNSLRQFFSIPSLVLRARHSLESLAGVVLLGLIIRGGMHLDEDMKYLRRLASNYTQAP